MTAAELTALATPRIVRQRYGLPQIRADVRRVKSYRPFPADQSLSEWTRAALLELLDQRTRNMARIIVALRLERDLLRAEVKSLQEQIEPLINQPEEAIHE